MKPLYDLSRVQPKRVLSPADGMVAPGLEEQYFDLGRRALELVMLSGQLCDKPHYPDILDLPCGHGRVLRWLRAHYDYAKITACDLDRGAVEFCAAEFGATPVYSQPDLNALPFTAQFDLIWVGSLLTHLPQPQWLAALDCFVRWTRECGVLIFTTQGRCYTSLLARGQRNVAENIDKSSLLEGFARDGFAYQPYFESKEGDYGVSVTSPEWLQGVLQRYPDIIMRAYLEEAWGMQDVVILYKKAGHYEPILGLPESSPTAPTTKKPGWLQQLIGT
jgi:SAM-dependent methyltransferase